MKSFLFLSLAVLGLFGCDSSTNPTRTNPPTDTSKVDTTKVPPVVSKVQTCLEARTGSLPKGTYAQRLTTLEKVRLDSLGCFTFPTRTETISFAGRMAATTDSVIFYNDSALFSVTIPYLNNGDTIEVVPTVVSLKNTPNNKADSVFLAVFDKANILSRKVKLKRANFGDSSEFGRTLWSVDNGQEFQVHFEIHSSENTWASRVIHAEPGGTISLNYIQIRASEVPRFLNVADSMYFYRLSYTGDTTDHRKFAPYGPLKIHATSIYGIAEIKVNGLVMDTLYPLAFSPINVDFLDNPIYLTATVTITDSAGYISTRNVKMWTDDRINVDDAPGSSWTTHRFRNWSYRDSTYSDTLAPAKYVNGVLMVPATLTPPKTISIKDTVAYYNTVLTWK